MALIKQGEYGYQIQARGGAPAGSIKEFNSMSQAIFRSEVQREDEKQWLTNLIRQNQPETPSLDMLEEMIGSLFAKNIQEPILKVNERVSQLKEEIQAIDSSALIGPPGPMGLPGTPGIDGVDGEIGNTGEAGVKGEVGESGIQGEVGLHGETGEQGIKGEIGLQGETGEQGTQGEAGPSR